MMIRHVAAYRNSLELALENGIQSIASPKISTGVYGYPKAEAEKIAEETVNAFFKAHADVDMEVLIVTYKPEGMK
ncbi:MAG: macro domain-containing protein [Clostridiales Family XIII bacterium]|jgi:O-acetyl-ADP-ribose deacetylase (regulator of RNase III)|nr:macro domain-containing protein [Clostridiales Family XIII bacterium]